jgi:hypothetical protein
MNPFQRLEQKKAYSPGSQYSGPVTPGANAVSVLTGGVARQLEYTFMCGTYPTAGTLTLESVYK